MFLTLQHIAQSAEQLAHVKPFYGTAFLVFKSARLPVGNTETYHARIRDTLRFFEQYYKPDPNTHYYFHACRAPSKNHYWVEENYPTSGRSLDKTILTTFSEAFIHPNQTHNWGWQPDYVKKLNSLLHQGKPIPTFYLAVWLYRDRDWPQDTGPQDIIETFHQEFNITPEEWSQLFDDSTPEITQAKPLLQPNKVSWAEIRTSLNLPLPPDVPVERGQTLAYLSLRGVGPAQKLDFSPAERLNLITGDNGLGKSFLLEVAWWALTGEWAGLPAFPRQDAKRNDPQITFQIAGEVGLPPPTRVNYDWQAQAWRQPKKRPTIPGVLIYARVDGSFAIWDSARQALTSNKATRERDYVFTKDQVWDGKPFTSNGKAQFLINGLIRDWVTWQNTPERYPFEPFKRVLSHVSPPRQSDLGPLEPGDPVRLPDDAREIPTLRHAYGQVPVVHSSAGVQRIIALAYLIIWAWEEHKVQSKLIRKSPEQRMVIQIDEIEAHLHPQWQRRILPALLDISDALEVELQLQYLITTHSPLVTASVEPVFDPEIDKLFHLDIEPENLLESNAVLKELPFVRYGPIDSWLISDVFELRHARSLEAESAIEDAKSLQLQAQPDPQTIREVSDRLARYLSAHDEFWPRWKYFAERHGVQV